MKISLNALKKYVKIDVPVEELLTLIGSRLVEIESVEDLSEKYKGIKIVKVAECEKIEGTHLSLCQIQKSEDEKDLIQVVCGAPNVHRGMLAAWIMPGAIVPETFGNENFRLSVRKLRGYDSNGMLAAADELGFAGASHDGIIEIDPADARPGDDFAEVFDMNDYILDIENKSLTHRPDTFGLIGFAREIAGILGEPFSEPDFLKNVVKFTTSSANFPKITISDPEICPAYTCAVFDLPDSALEAGKYFKSSDVFLYKSGMRPISPLVDLTNIIMLETGQPLHAFDYDKFVSVGGKSTPEVIVRLAREGETLKLLNDETIDLNENDIIITSSDVPVALAGAMGGESTEIDASTKRVLLESATFSLYNLRKTQMSHGILSEAITRFTKGIPEGMCLPVLSETLSRLSVTPESISVEPKNVVNFTTFSAQTPINLTTEQINSLLGTAYRTSEIKRTLENVGFLVEASDTSLSVTAPFWRTDIHIREDVIEEVGRLLGYDNIPLSFPSRPFVEAEIDPLFALKSKLRSLLSDRLGANEVLTYSFVSEDLEKKVGENVTDSYRIVNSISPELECFRQSLVPSLLDKIRDNEKAGFEDFSLYEMNQISRKSLGLTSENVPEMETHLSLVTLGDFYRAKSLLSELLSSLGISFEIVDFDGSLPYFEPLHSVSFASKGKIFASLGEIRASVLKNFKLSAPISAFELSLDALLSLEKSEKSSVEMSRFPFVNRDLTVTVDEKTPYSEIEGKILSILEGKTLIYKLSCVSIYKKSPSDTSRNISFHLSFSDPKKTLDSSAISAIMDEITNTLGA